LRRKSTGNRVANNEKEYQVIKAKIDLG